ncbi:DUF2171 domain-containing protein [Sphingomonas sp. TREG-RG-20F-R18-01]|uniref:DUF2171 domain-containing protein n=1 Tax=Sphingomonas sp. TREG-RG-20F-R18-01 TaxID=2914982 RepID=UPI001F5AF310|nr:DUF2171 domain-containing protein [Sphingomonas sp. TREG-RG-20F-R18-01]
MAYERYPRSNDDRHDIRDQYQDYGQSPYGDRDRYGRDPRGADRQQNYGSDSDSRSTSSGYGGGQNRDRGGYQDQGGSDRYESRGGYGNRSYGGGAYGDGGHGDRFQGRAQGREDYGRPDMYGNRDSNRAYGKPQDQQRHGSQGQGQPGYGRQPQGYDYDDRGFFDRAGDEVRSWFGDDEATRRRDMDARYDDQRYGTERSGTERSGSDDHYGSWRRTQIEALDRDYDEYRRENRTKFESEFGSWRTNRQTQRASLAQVTEHMEVLGSDGAHVGTVDKVRGDRILLTKNDADAGGRHHSIPSSWLQSVADKVTISKTAEDAKAHWRDEERNQAFFGDDDAKTTDAKTTDAKGSDSADGPRTLNRSFGATY